MKAATSTDRIEKQILLRAPRSRVWRALTEIESFNKWFGVELTGPFEPGKRVSGPVLHEGYRHVTLELTVERMEPERLFSWRWHPHAVEPAHDYSDEPTTLVVFELEEAEGGTRLTVVESGFDRIPLARRAEAFKSNDGGWALQLQRIATYVHTSA